MAQKQLQDAEQELDQAKQSENDMIKEKKRSKMSKKNMNAKYRQGVNDESFYCILSVVLGVSFMSGCAQINRDNLRYSSIKAWE